MKVTVDIPIKRTGMMEYFKGTLARNGNRIIVKKYGDEDTDVFGNSYIAEMVILNDGSTRFIKDIEEGDELCNIERNISEEEFNFLRDLAKLSNEVFLNQYVGGFPSDGTCNRILRDLKTEYKEMTSKYGKEEEC